MTTFKAFSIKGLVWNHLTKLFDYGLTYLISVIIARSLDNFSYSLFITTFSIGSILIILSSFGIDETLNKFVSQLSLSNQKGQIKYLLYFLLKYRVAALFISIVLVYLASDYISLLFDSKELSFYISIILLYVLFQNLNNFCVHYFTALLNTRLVFFVNTTIKSISLVLISMYLNISSDLIPIFVIITVSGLISVLIYLFFISDIIKSKVTPISNKKEIRNFFPIIWLNAILSMILGRYSDIILLGALLGISQAVGLYEIAFSFATAIDYFFTVGLVGIVISIFSTIAQKDRSKIITVRNQILQYYQLIVLPVMLFAIVNADRLIIFIYSDKYSGAIILFQVLIAFKIVIVNLFGSGLNISILVSLGKQKFVLVNRLILGILNTLINLLIIPIYGALGAISVTGFFLLLIYMIDFIMVSRLLQFKYEFKSLTTNLVIITPMLVLSFIAGSYSDINLVLLLVLYLAGLALLNLLFNKPILIKLKDDAEIFFRRV